MKKSLYRQVMFVLLMICLMLLIAIAIKIEVFKGLSTCVVFKTIVSIMKNSYVSSILCSILAVLIIYITQVYHSKKMLKKDFRCNEIIEDVYDGIEIYCKLKDEIPEKVERMPDEDVLDKRRREPLMFSTIPRCFILFTMFCKPYFTNPWQMYYKNCFIGNVNNVFLIKKSKILYQSIVISFGNHPFFQLLISRLQAFYNCRSINTCLF